MLMATCLVAAGAAAASEPGQSPRHEGVAMLYFSKSIGSSKHASAPVFGLRLSEYSVESNRPIVDMLNLRLRPNAPVTISALGLVNYRFSSANYDAAADSSGGGEEGNSHKALWITLGVAAAVGVACLAEAGICEDDNSDSYTPPGEGPG
jgi:hypothetical protein